MSKKSENWKANANVVVLVAAVVGLFTLNALRVALRSTTWSDNHSRGKARAAADILLLHNTIEGLKPKLASMPHHYALFRFSTALENASILKDELMERISMLDEQHRQQCKMPGAQMQNIPEIVAGTRAQLAQALKYVESGCFGSGPPISSTDWFHNDLLVRYNDADRASIVVASDDRSDDDDQNSGVGKDNRAGRIFAADQRIDERRAAGDDSVTSGESPSPTTRKLRLIQGGLTQAALRSR
jgi:hypothetical protein